MFVNKDLRKIEISQDFKKMFKYIYITCRSEFKKIYKKLTILDFKVNYKVQYLSTTSKHQAQKHSFKAYINNVKDVTN